MSERELAAEHELKELIAQARAYLALEAELGSDALARVELAATAVLQHAPEPRPGGGIATPSAQLASKVPDAQSLSLSHAEPPPASPAKATLAERVHRLTQLASEAHSCTLCGLHAQRKQSVFARGNPEAELVFVGEGPGAEEDRLGEPFVGPAGQLLDRMIAAMGYQRDEVYICNVVKCRPPENRTPRPEEAIACRRYLVPQLELVAPKVIVALGRCAAENLGVAKPEGPWRGRWGAFQGTPVLPTYHPAYLLRSPEQKRVVWDDLKLVLDRLGRPVPQRQR